MHLYFQYALVFYLLITVSTIGFTNGYIMPVCSENGGVCTDRTADGECANQMSLRLTNMSDLFSFVTKTMEVTRRWMYDQVYSVCNIFCKEPEEPPPPISYMETVWSLLGFREEPPKQKEIEYAPCNPSVFAVFMATKCFTARPVQEQPKARKKFLPYLATDKDFTEEDMESEDESMVVYEPQPSECPTHSHLPQHMTEEEEL